jgi:hypothetical protein
VFLAIKAGLLNTSKPEGLKVPILAKERHSAPNVWPII